MLLQQTEKKEPTRPTNLGGTCFYASAETLSLESPENREIEAHFFGSVGTIACSVVKNRVDLFWTVGPIACNVVNNRVDRFWPQNVCRRYAENSLDLSLDPN